MGEAGNYAMWMGGVYENTLREGGRHLEDQVGPRLQHLFHSVRRGLQGCRAAPPPGITASNPPDLPPTSPFEMYPRAFLPPYHYANPVTGNVVTLPEPSKTSETANE